MNLLYAYADQEMVVEDLVHFVQLNFEHKNNNKIYINPTIFIHSCIKTSSYINKKYLINKINLEE